MTTGSHALPATGGMLDASSLGQLGEAFFTGESECSRAGLFA
jgi:hypothetical protein